MISSNELIGFQPNCSNNTLANEDTGSDIDNNQANDKFYTQKEVDDMMARMKTSLQRKLTKPYEELGDIEELRQINEGLRVVLPKSKEHAKMMLIVAMNYLGIKPGENFSYGDTDE